MSYTLDMHTEHKRIVFHESIPHHVTHNSVLRVPKTSETYLSCRSPEGYEVRVGHHSVTLCEVGLVLVDHGE